MKHKSWARLGAVALAIAAMGAQAADTKSVAVTAIVEHPALDAVRDGVDVPGRSLRLIVFDRVPWPRPDILHRARKAHWKAAGAGANGYDDMLARLRLKQAYGRLIRRADDRGVFVMLDAAAPTRLFAALPDGVALQRVTLVEAIEQTAAFVGPRPPSN